jgi:hypothetical protein
MYERLTKLFTSSDPKSILDDHHLGAVSFDLKTITHRVCLELEQTLLDGLLDQIGLVNDVVFDDVEVKVDDS